MIIKTTINELKPLVELMLKLWPNHQQEELEADTSLLITTNQFFLLKENNKYIGFAQCSIRNDYVEGCDTTPVGYLEAIYIEKEYRNKGYAKELVNAAMSWAKEKGCSQFASDCEATNIDSIAFHKAIGFEVTNTIVCFKKPIE